MPSKTINTRLATWRAAERKRDDQPAGAPGVELLEAAVTAAREEYLLAVRDVAEGKGTQGIDAVPSAGAKKLSRQAGIVRSAAGMLQEEGAADQASSDSDQVVSDADQRESDTEIMSVPYGAGRPAGDSRADSDLRRLASSATRDETSGARDATSDARDVVLDLLADIEQPG